MRFGICPDQKKKKIAKTRTTTPVVKKPYFIKYFIMVSFILYALSIYTRAKIPDS